METPPHLAAGREAEARACAHLRTHGLRLVEKNFRCRGGEIDLIMRDGEYLVFVEVRFRSRRDFGGAAASVTAGKQGRLTVAAQHYLLKLRTLPPCRFDIVALQAGTAPEWIRDAFQPG